MCLTTLVLTPVDSAFDQFRLVPTHRLIRLITCCKMKDQKLVIQFEPALLAGGSSPLGARKAKRSMFSLAGIAPFTTPQWTVSTLPLVDIDVLMACFLNASLYCDRWRSPFKWTTGLCLYSLLAHLRSRPSLLF